jgi:hypothetical protein
MTRSSRNPARGLLRTAEEALSRPRRALAGFVPGWALPRYGTLTRLSRHRGMSALPACVGFGAQAASTLSAVAFGPPAAAAHQWTAAILKSDGLGIPLRHSAIAICITHVLNSSRAPTASLTGKLTRHERGPNQRPNRGRVCTETRCGASDGRQRANAPGIRRYDRSWRQVFSDTWWITGATPVAACGPCSWRRTSLTSGRYRPHRAELCGPAPARGTPLS